MGFDFCFERAEIFVAKFADSQRSVFARHLVKDHRPSDYGLERSAAQLLWVRVKRIGNSVLVVWWRTKPCDVRTVGNVVSVDNFFRESLASVDDIILPVPSKKLAVAIDEVPLVPVSLQPFFTLLPPVLVVVSGVQQPVFVADLMSPNFLVGLGLVEHLLVLQRLFANLAYQVDVCRIAFFAPRSANDGKLITEKVLAELGQLLCLRVVGRQPVGHIVLHVGKRQFGSTKRKRQQKENRAQQQHRDAANQRYRDREKTFDHKI